MATVFIPLARAQDALPNHLTKRVVGDYGYWSKYQTPAYGAAQIPYHKLTHINHARSVVRCDGHAVSALGIPRTNSSSLSSTAVLTPAGVKVLLLLGGDFPGLEASGNVQTLVDNVAAFEKEHRLRWRGHRLGISRNHWRPQVSGGTDGEASPVEPRVMSCRSMRRRGAATDTT